MDPRAGCRWSADLTIGCIPVPLSESKHFGVVQTSADARVTGFLEKPEKAEAMPGDAEHFLASMGIYVFTPDAAVVEHPPALPLPLRWCPPPATGPWRRSCTRGSSSERQNAYRTDKMARRL